MRDFPTVLGVITARGDSKSVPLKNIHTLAGKPLIAYTIDASRRSALLTRCIVSTDAEQIAQIALSLGADVPFMRPRELATDTTSSIEVVQHAISFFAEAGEHYDYVMILQPTSPLRTAADIDAAISIAHQTGADSVMSMKELDDMSVAKLKTVDSEGRIAPLVTDEGTRSALRQDMPKIYKRNAAIYLTKSEYVQKGDLFGEDSRAYIMPEERSIDINRPVDFELAEFFLSRQ